MSFISKPISGWCGFPQKEESVDGKCEPNEAGPDTAAGWRSSPQRLGSLCLILSNERSPRFRTHIYFWSEPVGAGFCTTQLSKNLPVTNDSSEPGLARLPQFLHPQARARILALHRHFHKHLWHLPLWFPLPFRCLFHLFRCDRRAKIRLISRRIDFSLAFKCSGMCVYACSRSCALWIAESTISQCCISLRD